MKNLGIFWFHETDKETKILLLFCLAGTLISYPIPNVHYFTKTR